MRAFADAPHAHARRRNTHSTHSTHSTSNAKVEPQIGDDVGTLELVFAHEQQHALRSHDHR